MVGARVVNTLRGDKLAILGFNYQERIEIFLAVHRSVCCFIILTTWYIENKDISVKCHIDQIKYLQYLDPIIYSIEI